MKLSRPAAVFAAVVLLAGGTAVAVNATTETHPVKLCSHNLTRVVSVPSGAGNCAPGTRAFYVAPDTDVQALATRADLLEEDPPALTFDPELSENAPGQVVFFIEGSGLEPGSDVTQSYFSESSGELRKETTVIGKADADGNFRSDVLLGCSARFYRLEGVDRYGVPIYSDAIAQAPTCP